MFAGVSVCGVSLRRSSEAPNSMSADTEVAGSVRGARGVHGGDLDDNDHDHVNDYSLDEHSYERDDDIGHVEHDDDATAVCSCGRIHATS